MRHAAVALLGVLTWTSCATRSAPVASTTALARADELIRQGCYDCLLDARRIYTDLPLAARRPVLNRLLEVELLLVLREKELALDPAETLARASAVASELGPAANASQYVAIVEAVSPDAIGTPRSLRPPPAGLLGRDRLEDTLAAIKASPFTPVVRQYLAESIQCGRPPVDPTAKPLPLPEDAPPLLVYRDAVCDNPVDVPALEKVRSSVLRFAETGLFMGRAAMAQFFRSDGSQARMFFEEAYARFPNSPSVTFHLGTVLQGTGDCRRAEGYFAETLALRPQHEDARLGRAVCRTYLSNPDGAIADATVLVDTAAYNRAEGYYWRAWNRRVQKQIEMARADIDNSRALLYNARVLTLAGMIEHDQQEWDKAKEDLNRAREMDSRECQARWYLGLVGYATEIWSDSAGGFADAAECYARLIAETEAQRDVMTTRPDVSEEFRSRQIAGFDAAIAEDNTQKSAADLNAAINYARAGDVDKATTYMRRAWVDPSRRTAVEDLRQVLGVPRW